MLSEKEKMNKKNSGEAFLEKRKSISWYDRWTMTFRSETAKFRYHFYSYYCTLGVPGKSSKDKNMCTVFVGSQDNPLNDIKVKGIARTHGKIIFDNSSDSLVYVKLTEDMPEQEKNQSVITEIQDGTQFYIGEYLVEFTKE